MKTSVLIPAYNVAATIEATLDSVLSQTYPPHEILVVNDGSTDATLALLRAYGSAITVIDQANAGASGARNALCKRATGDLIAFLDADDVWHPRYLEVQQRLFSTYPQAAAFFTGHVDFRGPEEIQWDDTLQDNSSTRAEIIKAEDFIAAYTKATGPFASLSYCCVPMQMLRKIGGNEPFDPSLRACDDVYLFYSLSLLGPIIYAPAQLVGYRITPGSLSSNNLRNLQFGLYVFELLDRAFTESASKQLLRSFHKASASKRREYAKVLMGIGAVPEARKQLWYSLSRTSSFSSTAKSLAFSFLTYMPRPLQPRWPSSRRNVEQSWKWWRWKANRG